MCQLGISILTVQAGTANQERGIHAGSGALKLGPQSELLEWGKSRLEWI